jgi:hypothetical protein
LHKNALLSQGKVKMFSSPSCHKLLYDDSDIKIIILSSPLEHMDVIFPNVHAQ